MKETRAKTVRGVANAYAKYNATQRILDYKNFPAVVVPYILMKSDKTLKPNIVEWLDSNCGNQNWVNVRSCIWFTDDSRLAMFILQFGGTVDHAPDET